MRINHFLFVLLNLCFISPADHAQVSINSDGTNPDNSSMLDIKSTDKGLLLPRMTAYQLKTIEDPATGLIVFNMDALDLYIFTGTYWVSVLKNVDRDTITPWICGDSLLDERDMKRYATVLIGTQCWMKQNLNLGTRLDGTAYQTDNDIFEKYCYDDLESSCGIYGGLYLWDEMMQYSVEAGVRGICPNGWHLPADTEWCVLATSIDATVNCSAITWTGTDAGSKMKSTDGWDAGFGGSNTSGFTGRPAGDRSTDGDFYNLGLYAYFWTSTRYNAGIAWKWALAYNRNDIARIWDDIDYGFSVRCIKND
jgi:uncharacterized protein (TIGR02145 family)